MRTGENIYKRKNGYWEGRYKVGYYPSGKTKYNSVYSKSYTECKDKLDNAKGKKQVPADKKRIKVYELFDRYINHIRGSVKESTISTYQNLYKNHIGMAFANIKVMELSKDMINDFLLDRLERYSKDYVASIKILLFSMLNYAYNDNIITEKINNTLKIKVPYNQIETFTEGERDRLELYLINNLNLTTLGILLVLYTGLRIGELCSLKIYNIDLKNNCLLVNNTMERIKNLDKHATTKTKIVITPPKSEKAIRDIPLPDFLVQMLKKELKQYNKNAYLLTGDINKFVEARTMQNKYKKILEECKIQYRKFHILRHTFATDCVINNIYDINTLSEILGHEDIKTTLKLYVHSNKSIKRKQVVNLDKMFISRTNPRIKAI